MYSRSFYRYKRVVLTVFVVLGVVSSGFGEQFRSNACYHVCFTPQNNCTARIVRSITQAQSSIYVQAYSFSAKPIVHALISAKKRGVDVKVILDKSHLARPQWGYQLAQVGVPVWIDKPAGIAHNKVMVIDKQTVITGSFNFSYSAQYRNHENVLFVTDKRLANRYLDNWKACQLQSTPLIYDGKSFKSDQKKGYTTLLLQAGAVLGGLLVLWAIFGPL